MDNQLLYSVTVLGVTWAFLLVPIALISGVIGAICGSFDGRRQWHRAFHAITAIMGIGFSWVWLETTREQALVMLPPLVVGASIGTIWGYRLGK